MAIIEAILGVVGTIVALAVIFLLLAGLFMIVFGIATGIDDTMQN